MTQAEIGAPGAYQAGSRRRVVPATLIAVTSVPVRSGSRATQWIRVGVAVVIWLTLALALGPVGPSVNGDLAAAASARTSYRYDRALAWYAEAEAAAPGDPRPYCLTGDVRDLQQEWALAEAAYQRCIELRPTNRAEAWLGLGAARSAAGDTAGAIAAWQKSADSGGATAMRRLGALYESQGNVAAAESAWKRLPASDAEARAHLGELALWRGDLASAHADFVSARAQTNAASQALAEDGFLPLASLSSLDGAAWGQLGYAFLVANTPALALAPLQKATTLDPVSESAHAYLGWTLWLLSQQGQTPNGTPASYAANAEQEIAKALSLSVVDGFAWFAQGTIAAANGAFASARADMSKAIAIDSKNPAVWTAAARIALAQADYLGAEIDFGNAAQLSTRPDESVTLLHFYADRGYGIESGRAASAAAARRWPQSEPIRFLQAQIADEAGDFDDATDAANAALLLGPTDPGPYVLLGRYAFQAGQYVAAAGYLHVALALQPQGAWAAQATLLLAPLRSLAV